MKEVNGVKRWYLDDKFHRIGGPAVEAADGSRIWYRDGKIPRINGPAVEDLLDSRSKFGQTFYQPI
jgi:hypothetical protein